MTKITTAIPDTKEGIRLLPEVVRDMFQEDMDGKDEGGVYEIKYGNHMFFVPKRMDDGVEWRGSDNVHGKNLLPRLFV